MDNNDGMRRILNMSTSVSGGTTEGAPIDSMAPDTRQWLQQALTSVENPGAAANPLSGVVDPSRKLRQATERLKASQNVVSVEDARNLLADIVEWTEFIDLAVDFQKLGGYDVLKQTATLPDAECRRLSADILGQVLQHNPYCQAKALEEGMFEVIYNLLADDDGDVRRKGLLALSGLVRSCAAAQDMFLANKGFSRLTQAITAASDDERFQAKAAFLLSCMTSESPLAAEKLIKIGVYTYALEMLEKSYNHSHEYLLSMVADLARQYRHSMPSEEASKFIRLLEFKLEAELNNDEHREAREHAQALLSVLLEQQQEGEHQNDDSSKSAGGSRRGGSNNNNSLSGAAAARTVRR